MVQCGAGRISHAAIMQQRALSLSRMLREIASPCDEKMVSSVPSLKLHGADTRRASRQAGGAAHVMPARQRQGQRLQRQGCVHIHACCCTMHEQQHSPRPRSQKEAGLVHCQVHRLQVCWRRLAPLERAAAAADAAADAGAGAAAQPAAQDAAAHLLAALVGRRGGALLPRMLLFFQILQLTWVADCKQQH